MGTGLENIGVTRQVAASANTATTPPPCVIKNVKQYNHYTIQIQVPGEFKSAHLKNLEPEVQSLISGLD